MFLESCLTKFYTINMVSRGNLVRLGSDVGIWVKNHSYHPLVNQYLIQMIAVACNLGADLKNESVLTLQVNGTGCIKFLLVEINQEGHIRACASYEEKKLSDIVAGTRDSKPIGIIELFPGGNMLFTVDFVQKKDRYQAVVELTDQTINNCMHHFFRQSQQIPTNFLTYYDDDFLENLDDNHFGYVGGSLMLQRMPYSNEHIDETEFHNYWVTDVALVSTLKKIEILDPALPSEKIINMLLHERKVTILEKTPLLVKCRCSFEKIHHAIKNFNQKDLSDMLVDGFITIDCEFCKNVYKFSLGDFS